MMELLLAAEQIFPTIVPDQHNNQAQSMEKYLLDSIFNRCQLATTGHGGVQHVCDPMRLILL